APTCPLIGVRPMIFGAAASAGTAVIAAANRLTDRTTAARPDTRRITWRIPPRSVDALQAQVGPEGCRVGLVNGVRAAAGQIERVLVVVVRADVDDSVNHHGRRVYDRAGGVGPKEVPGRTRRRAERVDRAAEGAEVHDAVGDRG